VRSALKTKLASISDVSDLVSGVFTPPLPTSVEYPLITIETIDEQEFVTAQKTTGLHRDVWQITSYASGAGAWTVVDTLMGKIRDEINLASGVTWSGKKVKLCLFDDGRDAPQDQDAGGNAVIGRSADYVIKWTT